MPLTECRVEQGRAICPYHGMALPPSPGESMFRFRGCDWIGERNAAVEFLDQQQTSEPWMLEVFRLEGHSRAPILLCLENFLDATHTAHVHPHLVRQSGKEKSIPAEGRAFEWGFAIGYREEGQQSGWLGRLAEPPRSICYGRYLHPFAAQVDYVGLDGRSYFRATAYMRPEREGTAVMVVVESSLWRMGLGPLRLAYHITRALFARVLEQDIDVLDRAWEGIIDREWAPADLITRPEDLAWPWLCAWANGRPPLVGASFTGAVRA